MTCAVPAVNHTTSMTPPLTSTQNKSLSSHQVDARMDISGGLLWIAIEDSGNGLSVYPRCVAIIE
jgi:hypothetical protein